MKNYIFFDDTLAQRAGGPSTYLYNLRNGINKIDKHNIKVDWRMSMKEKIIIRKAETSDFQGVHKLIMQVHKLHVNERSDLYKDIDPMNFDEFKIELSNSNNIYLVAEFKSEIVGICFSQIKELSNNKIMKDRKILHIENICVDKNHQKKGIGKKLYKEIVQIAKERNIKNIELMVWEFNENAIKFYKNLGMSIKNLKFEQKIN